MDVGAVGAIGAGAAAGASLAGSTAASETGGATAPAATTVVGDTPVTSIEQLNEIISANFPNGLEELGDLMKDLTSADILFALILAAAMQKKDDDESGGGGALGLLAGLALASELGQLFSSSQAGVGGISGAEGAAGGQLNLLA